MAPRPVILIHAGVGNLGPDSDLAEIEAEVRAALDAALADGERVLREGGAALDAVTASVVALEDCPLFNAGRGSVLTRDGAVEMDAAAADGARGRGGAVAGVRRVRNPVRAARAVLEDGGAELLCGEGADAFAAGAGCAVEPASYFVTDYWRGRWEASRGAGPALDHSARTGAAGGSGKHGTVGAAALDAQGRLAAATSTGGLLNKTPGRVGDSALFGAGCYADGAVAASLSGTGEHIIRTLAGRRVAEALARGEDLHAAAQAALDAVGAVGGEAGIIAVDREGRSAIVFNTSHMLRGWIDADGTRRTAVAVA